LSEIAKIIHQRQSDGHDGNVMREVSNLQDLPDSGSVAAMKKGQWSCPGLDPGIDVAVKYWKLDGVDHEEAGGFILLTNQVPNCFLQQIRLLVEVCKDF
jgi:hypothetical protein